MMEAIEIIKVLGPFGFSIFVSLYLLTKTTKVLEKMCITLEKVSEKVDNLDELKTTIKYMNFLIERLRSES